MKGPTLTMCCRKFFQIWNEADHYSPKAGTPLGWIVTIARRRAIDRLRRRQAYSRAQERYSKQLRQQPRNLRRAAYDPFVLNAGAAVGSIAGPIGAAIGGVVGAVAGKAAEKRRPARKSVAKSRKAGTPSRVKAKKRVSRRSTTAKSRKAAGTGRRSTSSRAARKGHGGRRKRH
jgi:Sigma-70 region 2